MNRGILEVERNWLDPDGLPGRPWFKHTLYAARYTYAHLELPGLTEAAEEKDWDRAARQAAILERAVARNAELVDALAQELAAGTNRPHGLEPSGDDMAFRYVILGSGRQGTAAAYDLGRFGDAARVVMADVRVDAARQAAARVNDLLGREVAEATAVYASEPASVKAVVAGAHVALSAVPYYFNLAITEACDRLRRQPLRPGREHRRRLVAAAASTRPPERKASASCPTAAWARASSTTWAST